MSDLIYKNFKATIVELKEIIIFKKEGLMTMSHQIENVNKVTKVIYKKEPNRNYKIEKYNNQSEKIHQIGLVIDLNWQKNQHT